MAAMESSVQQEGGDATKRSAARVRDNQRRARQRHKAFVEDLQRKVAEYEKGGIQATLEMQQAARTVAVENSRLRMMLRLRGAADVEIDGFLRSFEDGEPPKEREREVKRKKRTESEAKSPADGQQKRKQSSGSEGQGPSAPEAAANLQAPDKLAVLAAASAQQDCCGGKTQCIPNEPNGATFATPDTQVVPATGTPNIHVSGIHTQTTFTNPPPATATSTTDPPQDSLSSPTTMSCTAAAMIVAEMQGHGDSALAKVALGCREGDECTIKNTLLFQVLEGGPGGV